MKAEKYVVRACEFPRYGMAFEVVREGGRHPIALVATQEQARIVAATFTQACAIAQAELNRIERELRSLEVDRLDALRSGK